MTTSSWPERVTVAFLMVAFVLLIWLVSGSLVAGLAALVAINFLDRG